MTHDPAMTPEVAPVSLVRPLAVLLAVLLAGPMAAPPAVAGPAPAARKPADKAAKRITVSIAGMSLGDAIRLVAKLGKLNVALQDDPKQLVAVDFRDVPVQIALDTLFDMGGMAGIRRGDVVAVMPRKAAFERGLFTDAARVFQLRYASATRVAEFLNTSALVRPYIGLQGQGNQQMQLELAKADPRTNTVLVLGTSAELGLAERTIAALDRPMQQRMFKLSHANAVDVASILNATLFNTGPGVPGQSVRAEVESLAEGQGGTQSGGTNQVGGQATTVRTRTVSTQALPVEAKTSIAVPDTRTNAVIVMGSPEMLAIAASTIPELDRPSAQVSIEVEVVELNTQDALELGTTLGGQSGKTTVAGDPGAANNPGWSIAYDPAAVTQEIFRARLNVLMRDRKARLVAHPTVLAADNSEAQINIVDEVIKGTRIANQGVTASGQALIISEPIYGAAGVTLNILPRIGTDGKVTMRLHPTVSTIRETQRDSLNNQISLLSRRELLAQQVIVPSGTSLALGGLTQTNRISQANKLPLLGDLPLIGVLFNASTWTNQNAELMILVTPRIVR